MAKNSPNFGISGMGSYNLWMGQIVDDVNWRENINPKIHKAKDVDGWGYRYKVRIIGRDTETKEVPDDQLEMAEVELPVTAGSGHAGSQQTPNLQQGNYVVGYYKDGINGTQPVIRGVLANNSQTPLYGGDPRKGFVPRSGYKGKTGDKRVSKKDMYHDNTGPGNNILIESAGGVNQTSVTTVSDQPYDGKKSSPLAAPVSCSNQNSETKGISLTINNLLKDVSRLKQQSQKFSSAASDIRSTLDSLTSTASSIISSYIKSIFDKIRGFTLQKVQNAIHDVAPNLMPNERPTLQSQAEKATDAISCVFNNIMSGLGDLIRRILSELINNFVLAPICAIENLVSGLISDVIGPILDTVNAVLSQISSLLGVAISIAGKITEILDFVTGIFKFFLCDETLSCPEVEEWSFWDGVTSATSGLNNILSSTSIEASNGIPGFLSDFAPAGCNPAPVPCSPPTLTFVDSNGLGALANLVISASGSILGVDIIDPGSLYSSTVSAVLNDICNIGGGAVLIPIIDTPPTTTTTPPTTTTTPPTLPQIGLGSTADDQIGTNQRGQPRSTTPPSGTGGRITRVIVKDSGTGYLQAPNGSTGGGGRVFSNRCDTIVYSSSTGWNVYSPGSTINLLSGDEIYLPVRARVDLYLNGEIRQTLIGQGQTEKLIVNVNSTIVAPDCVPDQTIVPAGISSTGISTITNISNNFTNGISTDTIGISTLPGNVYPVVLSIGDIFINDPGINYNENDKIRIVPDNGAVLEPKFGPFGKLQSVEVVNPGIGFTEFPNITIESETGVNADLIPVFDIIRVGNLNEEDDTVPLGTPIIQVVDCVGRG